MKPTAVVSLDALGQKSVRVPHKSSHACAVMGIYQMWVWGAGLGQAEISFKPDYRRSSDPREALLSFPGTLRAALRNSSVPVQFGSEGAVLDNAPGHNCPSSWRYPPFPTSFSPSQEADPSL